MIKPRSPARPVLVVLLLLICALAAGCSSEHDLDRSLREITRPYLFSITTWEMNALGEEAVHAFENRHEEDTGDGVTGVIEYFAAVERIRSLESEIAAVEAGNSQGDLASLEAERERLIRQNVTAADSVEKILEKQIREALSQQGIFNPFEKYLGSRFGFPPVNFEMEKLPRLLVVSPRDRIESLREITLLPDIATRDMESIENKVDRLGVSSLVVGLGGMATYPNLVTDKGGLRFVIEAATEEWLHQYLAFKPLGFRYLLDVTGIRRDYDIATMNETLAGMVSKEIGAIIYNSHYACYEKGSTTQEATEPRFDFNQEMREIRRAVDDYLSRGEIEQAEEFMEQKRRFLATKGYYIRKLNQAYFAFYGAYADSPTSISPIGIELKELRRRSASLKQFLETAAAMTGRQDLAVSIR